MKTREALERTAAQARLACDTQRQIDWLERKVEWCILMVDSGRMALDDAKQALKKALGG